MYLSSVKLNRVWITDPRTPGAIVTAGSGAMGTGAPGQRMTSDSLGGEFREYAQGRVRLVTTDTRKTSTQIVLKQLTAIQREQLRRWAGTVLLFRDSYGNRMFGSYLNTDWGIIPRTSHGDVSDVQITFQTVTYVDSA